MRIKLLNQNHTRYLRRELRGLTCNIAVRHLLSQLLTQTKIYIDGLTSYFDRAFVAETYHRNTRVCLQIIDGIIFSAQLVWPTLYFGLQQLNRVERCTEIIRDRVNQTFRQLIRITFCGTVTGAN